METVAIDSLESFKQNGFSLHEVTRNLHENGPVGIMTDYEDKFFNQGLNMNRCVARLMPKEAEEMKYTPKDGYVEFIPEDDFDLPRIFECGQCFRWNADENGVYTGVAFGRAAKIRREGDKVIISGSVQDFEDIWREYFEMCIRDRPDFDSRNFVFKNLSGMIKSIPRFEVDFRQTADPNIKHPYVRDTEA